MNREVIKKDNYFSIELRQNERVTITIEDDGQESDSMVFVVPEDMHLNSYMKRKATSIQWK